MRHKLIIGIGHKRERGKDTAADYLIKLGKRQNQQIFSFSKDSFACSIKEGIGRTIFGLTDDQLNGEDKHIRDIYWDLTPRAILQKAGDSLRREFGNFFWIRVLERRIRENLGSIIIPDVRFRAEADAIKEMGGYLIKIDRSILFDPEIDNDRSETDLAYYWGWDHTVNNNGTIKELHLKLDDVFKGIIERVLSK